MDTSEMFVVEKQQTCAGALQDNPGPWAGRLPGLAKSQAQPTPPGARPAQQAPVLCRHHQDLGEADLSRAQRRETALGAWDVPNLASHPHSTSCLAM